MTRYEGENGQLSIEGDTLVLTREGRLARMSYGKNVSPRRIPLTAISGVRSRPATRLVNGSLQLLIRGVDGGKPRWPKTSHPDVVMFSWGKREQFEELERLLVQTAERSGARLLGGAAVRTAPEQAMTPGDRPPEEEDPNSLIGQRVDVAPYGYPDSWEWAPPPNWSAPDPHWRPHPGWRPDPDWGPAPAGWTFWRRPPKPPQPTPTQPTQVGRSSAGAVQVPASPASALIETRQDAEQLAVVHMQQLGFADARTTPSGPDHGVDVVAGNAVAQVKHYAVPIGAPMLQQLRGAAVAKQWALFYSLSGYTSAAMQFADTAGVALFRYDVRGSVVPLNLTASSLATSVNADDDTRAQILLLHREM